MRRTKEKAEQTREEIFRAGIKVFAQKGYAAATLSDVAREAGVTRGAIYWHFGNKEAFFHETTTRLDHYFDEIVRFAQEHSGTVSEIVTGAIARLIRKFVHDEEFRLMQEFVLRESLVDARSSCAHRFPGDEHDNHAIELLTEARDGGEIDAEWDPTTAYFAIHSYIAGLFVMIIDQNLTPTEHQIDQLSAFAGRGLAPIVAAATAVSTGE
jgi:TetR/AcrR family acrAB operon transcriptional repressor